MSTAKTQADAIVAGLQRLSVCGFDGKLSELIADAIRKAVLAEREACVIVAEAACVVWGDNDCMEKSKAASVIARNIRERENP